MKSFLDLLEEAKSDEVHHVMAFGRMNPPTTGHLKLIDKVKEIAKKQGAGHTVVASHSQDSKKNPLSPAQKVKHLKRYSPGTNFKASSKEHPTFLHHAAELHKQGVTHLHMVAGSDRVEEYKKKLQQYNGTHPGALYNFKKIHVHSAGQRDPDAEGTTGMSGTKMRDHAKNKDIKSFKQGVPSHVSDEHAHELMHDTRKGMGLHEATDRGIFKAIFVTGGPGSGKDIIIREAIPEATAVEYNLNQAFDYLSDKGRLAERNTGDVRLEAIRFRKPLIINCSADNIEKITYIKEELEDMGYSSMMVFVNSTNEVSKERNSRLSKMMVESLRYDKWQKSQENKKVFSEMFKSFVTFDNTKPLDLIEEDITEIYKGVNHFIDYKSYNDISFSWLENRNTLNSKSNFIFEGNENVKSSSKFIQRLKEASGKSSPKLRSAGGARAAGPSDAIPDNRAGDANADDPKWNAPKRTRTFSPGPTSVYAESSQPTIKVYPQAKEKNFSQDKDKIRRKKFGDTSPTVSQRMRNVTGLGPEFDTRQQGTVYPMSGLGDVTYREEYKSFKSFKEAIDDPGAVDMGVGGVLGGASNKEPMSSNKDNLIGTEVPKKKKKQEK
jgi:cytidyltransferase-like protein